MVVAVVVAVLAARRAQELDPGILWWLLWRSREVPVGTGRLLWGFLRQDRTEQVLLDAVEPAIAAVQQCGREQGAERVAGGSTPEPTRAERAGEGGAGAALEDVEKFH